MRKGPVLLVDDEPVVLQVHAAAVQHFGFEVILAETGEDALTKIGVCPPSLIISDVQMPGEGGFDFIQTLCKKGLKSMPVIYLTGYDDIDIIRGGLRAGGDDFIIKGGSVDVLYRRIALWMASGFSELPLDIRRRALLEANQVKGDNFSGIKSQFNQGSDILERVTHRIEDELKPMQDMYGTRLIERLCFMGRMSHMLISESKGFADLVRFPDHMDNIVRHLDVPWAKDMGPLFKSFDDWAVDRRFLLAAVEPLKAYREYSWFQEDME